MFGLIFKIVGIFQSSVNCIEKTLNGRVCGTSPDGSGILLSRRAKDIADSRKQLLNK